MNKSTNNFKNVISAYLKKHAEKDSAFKEKVMKLKDKKNIDDCITYILNTVKKSGSNGFTDEEIFGMALHYYEEESIDVGKDIASHIVVNHIVELTDEEIQEEKEKAKQEVFNQERKRITTKKISSKKTISKQINLF